MNNLVEIIKVVLIHYSIYDEDNFKLFTKKAKYEKNNDLYILIDENNEFEYLNDYPNKRFSEYAYKFKDDEGNILVVRDSYLIFNSFKHLEPLKTYSVKYFKDDLIREIELLK